MATDNFLHRVNDDCEKTVHDDVVSLVPVESRAMLVATPVVPAEPELVPVLEPLEEFVSLDPAFFAALQPFFAYALPGFSEPVVAQARTGSL